MISLVSRYDFFLVNGDDFSSSAETEIFFVGGDNSSSSEMDLVTFERPVYPCWQQWFLRQWRWTVSSVNTSIWPINLCIFLIDICINFFYCLKELLQYFRDKLHIYHEIVWIAKYHFSFLFFNFSIYLSGWTWFHRRIKLHFRRRSRLLCRQYKLCHVTKVNFFSSIDGLTIRITLIDEPGLFMMLEFITFPTNKLEVK